MRLTIFNVKDSKFHFYQYTVALIPDFSSYGAEMIGINALFFVADDFDLNS